MEGLNQSVLYNAKKGTQYVILREYRGREKSEVFTYITHTRLSAHLANKKGNIRNFLWKEYGLTWSVLSKCPPKEEECENG